MIIEVKVRRINSVAATIATIEGGADYIGLAIYPPSPCASTLKRAHAIATQIPARTPTRSPKEARPHEPK